MDRPPEFVQYLTQLQTNLKTQEQVTQDIVAEIGQSLSDKHNDYLLRGYSEKESVSCVLQSFEDPLKLANLFNKIHREGSAMSVAKFVYNRKVIYTSFVLIFIATALNFVMAMGSFLPILSIDFGPLGWHNIDNNLFISLTLSITLLILYCCSLYNLLFKKLLPPKYVIWTAYANIFLDLVFLVVTK